MSPGHTHQAAVTYCKSNNIGAVTYCKSNNVGAERLQPWFGKKYAIFSLSDPSFLTKYKVILSKAQGILEPMTTAKEMRMVMVLWCPAVVIYASASASSSDYIHGKAGNMPLYRMVLPLCHRERFLSKTIAFWKGHSVARYVCSLAPLTLLTRSAALCFATLASLTLLARSVHGLAHSLCSLPCGMVEICKSVFTFTL